MTPRLLIYMMIVLSLTGCTDFIIQIEKDNQWAVRDSGQIMLHYRPEGYSSVPSPDIRTANRILYNQNLYIKKISEKIGYDFTDNVIIYLFNSDESSEKIGTTSGGHAIPSFLSFYYVYRSYFIYYTDQYGVINPPIGAHEIAHVITHHLLGTAGTKLMSEGYAVWLDGSYGRTSLRNMIRSYHKPETMSYILKPSEMLINPDQKAEIFYPNAGIFIQFLVSRYGIALANKLFIVSGGDFISEFEQLTNESFNNMEEEYATFLEKL